MTTRRYNVCIGDTKVGLEKIVVSPITVAFIGMDGIEYKRRTMFVAAVYSLIYENPMFVTEPSLTASNAVEKAFVHCIEAEDK